MTTYQHLQIERLSGAQEGITVVYLNRPEVFNAINQVMDKELTLVWADLDRDVRTRVIVVTGRGKAFSAGGDLEMVQKMTTDRNVLFEQFRGAKNLVHNMINCEKPIIACVNGVAVGAGMVVAMMADITICSTNARFNDGHIRLGVAAGDHAAAILPLLIGMAKTKYYTLTGNFITAQEAEKMNMISKLTTPEKLWEETIECAMTIAAGPQRAIRLTKYAFNQWLRQSAITAFDYSTAVEMLGFIDDDVQEGMAALRGKRAPDFPSKRNPRL
jgi:enoyl-CoA hydratase